MRTTLGILLAVIFLFAALSAAFAQNPTADFDTLTMREVAAFYGWNQPVAATLPPFVAASDTLTMLETAASHGWTQPQVVDSQFAAANIDHLVNLVSFVANRHYDGDVIAACDGVYEIFESDAQMNHVIFVLTGT